MGWHLRVGVRVVPALRGRVCHAPARVGECVCPCPRCAAGLRDRNPVCLALGHAASPPQPPTAQAHTDSLNTLVALHQLYQYTQKYYDEVGAVSPGRGHLGSPSRACLPPDVTLPQIISALEEDPAAQKMQLAFRLQQIAAALENKVTDL